MLNTAQNQIGSDSLPSAPTAVTETAPTLASSAMLVEVNISHWAGRKKDKRASADVTHANHADTGVASVNKKLLANSDTLRAIQTHVTAARNIHSNMTMPWSNSGLRLLPTAQYFKYSQAMSQMQNEFDRLTQNFLTAYNDEVIDVQLKLGDLFSHDDYPTVETLDRKFAFRTNYMPLPNAGDFRVDIGNDALREVQETYADFYTKQYNAAMNDVWTRLHKTLTNMSERLDYGSKEDKKIFRDSLVGNVYDMIELLRVCNVTGSHKMSQMADHLENAMSGVTADGLREDDAFRANTKRAVDAAIKSLPSLDI
ncbi:MAG: hypothetical protein CMJ25_32800 [Phycisphaerae bacterium]|nr:hypothetical protein [Phycisphaerae bacterium]